MNIISDDGEYTLSSDFVHCLHKHDVRYCQFAKLSSACSPTASTGPLDEATDRDKMSLSSSAKILLLWKGWEALLASLVQTIGRLLDRQLRASILRKIRATDHPTVRVLHEGAAPSGSWWRQPRLTTRRKRHGCRISFDSVVNV